MRKIYLASPYSSTVKAVCNDRFQATCKAAAKLMREGYNIFSPIAHSHPVSQHIGNHLDHNFWLEQDLSFLDSWADEMWVLMIDGWEESEGIAAEIKRAEIIGLPVKYILMRD